MSTLLFLLLALTLSGQTSQAVKDRHVTATVIGENTHIEPGKPYRIGLLLEHEKGWHTYWKSTATGYASSVEWTLPEGFEVSGFSWPTPHVYNFQGWIEFVYEDTVLLMATLTTPENWDADRVELGFKAEWLMCAETCIPGEAEGTLVLPVSSDPATPAPAFTRYFAEADASLPANPESYTINAWKEGNSVILQIDGPDIPGDLYFFDDQALFEANPESTVTRLENGGAQVILRLDEAADGMPERLTGVLKGAPGWPELENAPSVAIDLPIENAPPAAAVSPVSSTSATSLSLQLILLAFTGGLILNLMPCVFPVLGIKIMGFVGQAGSSRQKVIAHGLTFAAGVLVSFWVLSAVLLVLRAGGNQLGWGFQLQSPGFVLALAVLLFAFGLNMSGLFEFGQSAVGIGSDLTGKSGLTGSFFSGVLATVVATPCAAPFLAPALGAALTLPPVASILLFTCVGLGLSLPYLLLSTFPSLVQKLPRPGPWMETFKQLMSFFLYGTVAYLIWVLAGQLTESGGYSVNALLKVLLSLLLVSLGLWVFGRWGAFHRKRRIRLTGYAAALVILAGALLMGKSAITSGTIIWEDWEPGKAEELAADGKIVYVDFTARWCLTCQTNKSTVFSSGKVRRKIDQMDVVTLKADWTNRDPRISEALASYGRSAVPFNLVYGPGLDEPRILPELLTPGTVLKALDEAASP